MRPIPDDDIDQQSAATIEPLAINETPTLIASDKVQGTAIYDASGTKLGAVEHVMLDKVQGRVAYVVMSVGGMLGVPSAFRPVPWDELTYDQTRRGYVLRLSSERLAAAPSFPAEDAPWSDPLYERRVSEYYYTPFAF